MRAIAERFAEKVFRTNRCWLWTAGTNGVGYGMISRGAASEGRMLAHRLSYELHVGEIPDGLLVLHACDNQTCVNPDHLFLGTHLDNALDKTKKGRGVTQRWHGEDHPRCKYPDDLVRHIRKLLSDGLRPYEVRTQLNLPNHFVKDVARGKRRTSAEENSN